VRVEVLQSVAVCCSVLQCVAMWCSVMQCVAVCCSVLHSIAVHCSALQCIAACCSVLQCIPVCCSVLQCVAVCCIVSQCVAVCRSVLQCVAKSWQLALRWQAPPKSNTSISKFSKISTIVFLNSKLSGELTYQNFVRIFFFYQDGRRSQVERLKIVCEEK